MHETLGVTKKQLQKLVLDDEAAIIKEVTENGSSERDASGWNDADWLSYICDESAEEKALPDGMPSDVLDKGHAGMSLDVFTQNMQTISSGLKRAHVLALAGVHLHDYGKAPRPNRKLGHATVVGQDRATVDALAARILG